MLKAADSGAAPALQDVAITSWAIE